MLITHSRMRPHDEMRGVSTVGFEISFVFCENLHPLIIHALNALPVSRT